LFVRLVVAMHRHGRFHDRPIARVRFDLERPAEHFGALAHADETEEYGKDSLPLRNPHAKSMAT
jgi:hypothetical protein